MAIKDHPGEWDYNSTDKNTCFCRLLDKRKGRFRPFAVATTFSYRRAMLAVLPPISKCVADVAEVTTQSVVLQGKGRAIRDFLEKQKERIGASELALSMSGDADNANAVLRFGANTPY